jgi:hypothetical protein
LRPRPRPRRLPRLDDTRLATLLRAWFVRGDGSETTEAERERAVADFHHWRRYDFGLDAQWRLKERRQAFSPNADRLREFARTHTFETRFLFERRTEAPADTRPVRVDRPRGTA